jgi:plastocyanin
LLLASGIALGFAAASWAGGVAITQHNLQFSQPRISIHAGDTIDFINADNVTHNISVRGGANDDTLDLGLQRPKVVVSHTFQQRGDYSVVCSIHPRMRLMVSVN